MVKAFYFLEGDGARDTLYLGYDPNADNLFVPQDTVYGEKKIPVDTSVFNVRWDDLSCGGPVCDSMYKVNVSSLWLNFFPEYGTIRFQYGNFPLQVSWDVNLFHSDSLPYPDQDPLPRAQGNLYYQFPFYAPQINGNWINFCQSSNDNLLISDSSYQDCWAKDSVSFALYFGNPNGSQINGYLTLAIYPWTGEIAGMSDVSEQEDILVYPNPANDKIYLRGYLNSFSDEIVLYNVFGEKLKTYSVKSNAESEIDVSDLAAGVYFLKINSSKKEIIRKIILTK